MTAFRVKHNHNRALSKVKGKLHKLAQGTELRCYVLCKPVYKAVTNEKHILISNKIGGKLLRSWNKDGFVSV